MKTASKKTASRKRAANRRQSITVTLPSATIDQARAIGGTVARGIEMSVAEYWAGIQPPAKAKREKQK